jgi:hypothetical protein
MIRKLSGFVLHFDEALRRRHFEGGTSKGKPVRDFSIFLAVDVDSFLVI